MYKKIIIQVTGLASLFLIIFLALSNTETDSSETKKFNGTFQPIVVLELFTSQGCSSCPPADALLEESKKQFPEKVFALSYHVDYWNYIGWEDPFSKGQYTRKQSAYNRKFGYDGNYTPEMVVNGKEHFVGSNRSKLISKIGQYGTHKAQNKILINDVKSIGDTVVFDYVVEGDVSEVSLRCVLVLDERTTFVKRGENKSRTLTNSNIVIAESYIDLSKSSSSANISIPTIAGSKDGLTLILLTEMDDLSITGAAKQKI